MRLNQRDGERERKWERASKARRRKEKSFTSPIHQHNVKRTWGNPIERFPFLLCTPPSSFGVSSSSTSRFFLCFSFLALTWGAPRAVTEKKRKKRNTKFISTRIWELENLCWQVKKEGKKKAVKLSVRLSICRRLLRIFLASSGVPPSAIAMYECFMESFYTRFHFKPCFCTFPQPKKAELVKRLHMFAHS